MMFASPHLGRSCLLQFVSIVPLLAILSARERQILCPASLYRVSRRHRIAIGVRSMLLHFVEDFSDEGTMYLRGHIEEDISRDVDRGYLMVIPLRKHTAVRGLWRGLFRHLAYFP